MCVLFILLNACLCLWDVLVIFVTFSIHVSFFQEVFKSDFRSVAKLTRVLRKCGVLYLKDYTKYHIEVSVCVWCTCVLCVCVGGGGERLCAVNTVLDLSCDSVPEPRYSFPVRVCLRRTPSCVRVAMLTRLRASRRSR